MKLFIKNADENSKMFNNAVSKVGDKNHTAVLGVLFISFADEKTTQNGITGTDSVVSFRTTKYEIAKPLIDSIPESKKVDYVNQLKKLLNLQ